MRPRSAWGQHAISCLALALAWSLSVMPGGTGMPGMDRMSVLARR